MTGNIRRNLAVTLVAGGTNPLKLRLNSAPPSKIATPVSAALKGQGGTPAYAYSITAGALPTTATFTASISTTVMTVSAVANGAIVIGQPIFGTGVTSGQKVQSFGTGTGGTGTYNLSISNTLTSRAMTATLALAVATGIFSGTPSVPGAYSFTAQVQDSTATVFSASFEMPVQHILQSVNGTPLIVEAGLAYSNQLTVINATGTVTWALTSGSLPTSLSMSVGGLITGTYPGAGSLVYNFVVTATDSGTGDALPITLSAVTLDGLNLAPGGMPDCTRTFPYVDDQYVNTTTGGLHPLTFSAIGLPTSLSINPSTGQITGTTKVATGLYAVTVKVRDALGAVSTRSTNVTIYNPTVIQPQKAGSNVGVKGASNINFDGIGATSVTNDGTTMTVTLGATSNVITENTAIPANSSVTVHRKLTIAAGKKLTLGAGAILRID